jgi:hypothetical protein
LKDLRGAADERLLEKIARVIPGYGGYKDKELRREADKLQRTYLSKRIREEKARLERVNGELGRKLFMDAIGEADRTAKRMEKVMDRVRFASYGYAGFFDLVKVRENELDKIYEYDAGLLEDVEKISRSISELEDSLESQSEARSRIGELNSLVIGLDAKLNEREDLLKGMA